MKKSIFGIKFDKRTDIYSDKLFPKQNIRIGEYTIIAKGTFIRSNVVINNNVTIGKNCNIGNFTLIREHVTIGNNVTIGGFNVIELYAKIGNNTHTQSYCLLSEYSKTGNNVFIGPNFNNPADNTIGQSLFNNTQYKANPAIIENDCRIGAGVLLKPGIVIKKGTIIGMGSLVTKDTGEGHMYYGSPATKKIKKGC